MEKDDLDNDHLTKGIIVKWLIWQEDEVVDGRNGKGSNATGCSEYGQDTCDKV